MGERGPAPKRSDQRLGHRATAEQAGPLKVPADLAEMPDGDPDWHPIALRWFNSLKSSGQRVFYADSDWLTAYAVAESMSREFKPQPMMVGKGDDAHFEMVELPPKAASLMAWLKGAASLLATEGDRRRVGIELQFPKPTEGEEVGDVPHLDDARARLRGAG